MKTPNESKFIVKLSSGKIISEPMDYKDALQVFMKLFDQVSGVSVVPDDSKKEE
ncbi:hypothetical protein [Paenibacillus aestuarii]|uniref:Uncharacterized protein n=1 Tax=Paenibacillus aestuarii TaxID=516965 RepID=A0ABW0KBZ1_9BACL|nr:hypothetical protein [Paenibacillus aestuarii]